MNEENPEVESVELPESDQESGEIVSGKQMKPVVFIVILVIMLGFQVSSSWLLMNRVLEDNPYFPGSAPDPEAGLYGILHTLDGIIINPTDSNGSKVLLVDIGFETGSEDVVLELQKLEPLLRDNINTFLSAQRLPVLTDIRMRDLMREKVKEIVNHNLTSGKVGRVFFVRYVLQ